ncbi:hypothetical protein [Nocardiopsis ansamitocini]|uniref:Uncharacterized protein n=1 Tax=Nocardiopsis ansamitocini TaxID=1670832 RepID=A0A9W6PAX3_9ACTN|nr:hypothetical protein [Nocardiopsis ansamitocini]GLU50183.1 hypothetical protein Nans01_45340 [Nocardiopsis ansamitocini]
MQKTSRGITGRLFAACTALGMGISLMAAPAAAESTDTRAEGVTGFSDEELLEYGDLTRSDSGTVTYSIELTSYDDGSVLPSQAPTTLGDTKTELHNGTLRLTTTNCHSVKVSYTKLNGATIERRLGYSHLGVRSYRSWGSQRDLTTHSSSWSGLRLTGTVTGILDVRNQQIFLTPAIGCR